MGTPTVTWDGTFEGTPAGSDDPRACDDRIREVKVSVRERKEREHGGATSEASARHGVHRKSSARASYASGDPTTVADGTSTRALNSTDDDGRIHLDSTSKRIRGYDGSAWFSPRGVADDAGTNLNLKILNIGDWNMDSTIDVNVAHGLTTSKIIGFQVCIRDDGDTYRQLLAGPDAAAFLPQAYSYISSGNVYIRRLPAGAFDNTNYDSTSYNRGWILIWYTD